MMAETAPLRIGLLIDGPVVNKYVNRLIDRLATRQDIDLRTMIFDGAQISESKPYRYALYYLDTLIFLMAIKIEVFIVRVLSSREYLTAGREYMDHFTDTNLSHSMPLAQQIHLIPPPGSWTEGCIAGVARQRLDLLIQCGTATLPDEILSCARLGVLRHRYGDGINDPPGFWETYYRRDVVHCAVERLTTAAGRRVEILVKGTIVTKPLFTLTQTHLYAKAYHHLTRLIEAYAAGGVPMPVQGTSHEVRSQHAERAKEIELPRFYHSICYIIKVGYRMAKQAFLRVVGLKQRWSISILADTWEKAEFPKIANSIQPPAGRFWADPFLYVRGDKTFCFVEEFQYETRRGHIAALEITDSTIREFGPVLVEPFHLSFPFVFEYDGDTFMCPECSATRTITLYKCAAFPKEWRVVKILMHDVSAVDTMIFYKNRRWWMLTNIDYTGLEDYSSELYLFYAELPYSDNWTPHPQNPVKIDANGGRNGGLIVQNGKIFRVGQRQSFGQCGRGILVFEIDVLNESAYAEKLVREMDVGRAGSVVGTHHLSSIAGRTVVDHVGWAL
jgi:hypothetical protein